MSQLRTNVYQYFQTDDIPTEQQFQYTWSSIWFKDEKFSISDTTGLEKALQNKLGINHASDENAHQTTLAKLNASNLNDEQKEAWKVALGVGSIPDNVALVDLGESPEVFNKQQIRAMAMMIADYTIAGKIRADKIEALGLTDLIEASENTLAAFVANSGNYEFQKNDFIALPDMNGNFSLFMFKGGNKSIVANYLPTGLTKITMAMVEGLQAALDGKMGQPNQNGSFFVKNTNGLTSWQNINVGASYLLFWDGDNFKTSSIFREASGNKFGIGNSAPTEQLHLTGRIRTTAVVLDDNSETLPNQITKNGNRYYGSNSSGVKRGLMYNDYDDFLSTFQGFSAQQSLTLSQLLAGGSGSDGAPNVNLISPPIVQNQYDSVEYVLLRGVNLKLNTTSMSIQILSNDKNTVLATIPNNQIQLSDSGTTLVFFYNFHNFPVTECFIKITSGVKVYITTLTLKIVDQIENINTSSITWDYVYANGVSPSTEDTSSGATISFREPAGQSVVPKLSIKSSELFAQGDDFYIELKINFSSRGFEYEAPISQIGLGYTNQVNINSFKSLVFFGWCHYYSYTDRFYINNTLTTETAYPSVQTVIFMKTGNLFRIIFGSYTEVLTLSNNSAYSIFIDSVGRAVQGVVSLSIIKAFKFN